MPIGFVYLKHILQKARLTIVVLADTVAESREIKGNAVLKK
jgi:hypothetical protein